MSIRVLIADDDTLVRAGLRMMIETCPALHAEDTPSSSADVLESRRMFETIIFDNNETAIYLWCRATTLEDAGMAAVAEVLQQTVAALAA